MPPPQDQDMFYPPGTKGPRAEQADAGASHSAAAKDKAAKDKEVPEAQSAESPPPEVATAQAAPREKIETENTENADAGDPSALLAELLTGVYRAEGMMAQGFHSLRERLQAIELHLGIDESDSSASDENRSTTEAPAGARAGSEVKADEKRAEQPPEAADDVETFDELPPEAAPATPAASPARAEVPVAQPAAQAPAHPAQPVRQVQPATGQSGGGNLEAIVFPHELAYQQPLASERGALLHGLTRGDDTATSLVGQLLIFRSASVEKMPQVLKDLGEAWYRWRPNHAAEPDALRDALIAWVHQRMDAVGLGNRIELVRVGDRYDSKRHNAKQRGVEVSGVYGWVVLRDNGKVYTKANVTVA